jgi:hypothetical protein
MPAVKQGTDNHQRTLHGWQHFALRASYGASASMGSSGAPFPSINTAAVAVLFRQVCRRAVLARSTSRLLSRRQRR